MRASFRGTTQTRRGDIRRNYGKRCFAWHNKHTPRLTLGIFKKRNKMPQSMQWGVENIKMLQQPTIGRNSERERGAQSNTPQFGKTSKNYECLPLRVL